MNEFIWNKKNAQGVAARHHDATGHSTWADVNMMIRYGDSNLTQNRAALTGRAKRKGER